ncbi:interstitial collagenase A-like [Eurytemora carolleeae]|uniref:interstitial collagenase A-like n=1 Tax=Eurytemora carolleeae TaxID=1294199 RepID=UPI000C778F7B|nr:interstitial collagenase A-like [Eurytemora carolleeae]|eukprot:XP_023348049.1 interstitial collagenase A-like [Eurytemora affinis]
MQIFIFFLLIVLEMANSAEYYTKEKGEKLLKQDKYVSALLYLENYGYLDSQEKENNATLVDIFHTGLARLQSFFEIPQTGMLDERTLEGIRKPRCGVRDLKKNGAGGLQDKIIEISDKNPPRRFRRFSLSEDFFSDMLSLLGQRVQGGGGGWGGGSSRWRSLQLTYREKS